MKDYFKKLFLLKIWVSSSMFPIPIEGLGFHLQESQNNNEQPTTKEEGRVSKKYHSKVIHT